MNVFELVGSMTIKGVDKVETSVRSVSGKAKSSFAEMGGAADKAASEMESGAGRAKGSVGEIGSASKGASSKVSSAMAKIGSAVKGIASDARSGASGFAAGMDKVKSAAKAAAKGMAVVTGASAALGAGLMAFTAGADETVENMGKLENAFSWSGRSIEEANQVYKNFLGLCGDSDQATEAALDMNNLADAGADINTWYDIASGAVSAFGDALPVENLIESANETIRCGQVTGGLADALNWTSINAKVLNARLGEDHPAAMSAFNAALEEGLSTEDAMNQALAECSDEQERQQILTEVLASQYSELGVGYQETSKELIAARQAQGDWNAAVAEAGKAAMPFTTAVTEIGTTLLEDALPYVEQFASWMQEKLPAAKDAAAEAMGWLKDNVIPPLGDAFAWLKDEILPPLMDAFTLFKDEVLPPLGEAFTAVSDALAPLVQDGLQWLADNLPAVVPLVGGLVAAFVAFQATLAIASLISAVSSALSVMREATTLAAGAQALLNSTMLANPIVLVVSLLAGLVAALIVAYNTNEDFRNFVNSAWESVSSFVGGAVESLKGFVQGFMDKIQGAWDKVVGFKDGVVRSFNTMKDGIGRAINNARDTVGRAIDAIKNFFNFKFEWPHIPLPHFSISGSVNPLDWLKGGLPRIGVEWYAKAMDEGMILDRPTVFGFDPSAGKYLAGGEAGSETVVGTGSLMEMIRDASRNGRLEELLEAILALLQGFVASYNPETRLVLDTGVLVGKTAPAMGKELARIQRWEAR